MAQPFVLLGLKGANALIDKHFDKVPDKILHPETYHPANLTSKQRRRRTREKRAAKNRIGGIGGIEKSNSGSSSDDKDSVEESAVDGGSGDSGKQQQQQRGAPSTMYFPPPPTEETYAGPPLYSREPPRLRPEYAPSPPPIGSGYPSSQGAYAPPPVQPQSLEQRSRRDSYGDEDYYSDSYRQPRRPKAVTRRSSSYHGPRGDTQVARRSGSGSEMFGRARDKAHRYGLKNEVEGMFTKSKEGLAGSAVGALVGGWAAHKAQEAKGREKHATSPLVTLLGAAIGGLAVNAVIDKYEEGKETVAEKQGKWDEKFGDEKGGDRGVDSDGARSHRSHRSKRDSRYDDGYGSDDESDGGRSYRSHRSRRSKRESRGNMSDGYD